MNVRENGNHGPGGELEADVKELRFSHLQYTGQIRNSYTHFTEKIIKVSSFSLFWGCKPRKFLTSGQTGTRTRDPSRWQQRLKTLPRIIIRKICGLYPANDYIFAEK